MPFLFAGLALAVGLYLVLEWWANASTAAAKKALVWGAVVIALLLSVALLSRAGPTFAVLPLIFTGFRLFNITRRVRSFLHSVGLSGKSGQQKRPARPQALSRDEALDILGLQGRPSATEINIRYKTLIAKAHPDAGGSEWLAARINAARDCLMQSLSDE